MDIYEMLNYVGVKLPDPGHTKYPPGVVMDSINEFIQEVAGELIQLDEEYLTAKIDITPSADGVTLPANYIFAIELSTPAGQISLVQPGDRFPLEVDGTAYRWIYGETLAGGWAYIRGNKIYFSPAVTADHTLYYAKGHPAIHAARPLAIGATSITFPAKRNLGPISDQDGYYVGATIQIIDGPGKGFSTEVQEYDGATRVAEVYPAWPAGDLPDTTSKYQVACELPTFPDLHRIVCRLVVADLLSDDGLEKKARIKLHMALEALSDRQRQNAYGRR